MMHHIIHFNNSVRKQRFTANIFIQSFKKVTYLHDTDKLTILKANL